MDNLIDKIVAYIKSLSREDIILLLFILSPAILTTILMAIGEADQRETQRRLENRPNVTWPIICTGKSPISVRMSLQLQSVRICPGVSVRVAHRLQAAGMWCAVPVSEALILVVNLLINNQKL